MIPLSTHLFSHWSIPLISYPSTNSDSSFHNCRWVFLSILMYCMYNRKTCRMFMLYLCYRVPGVEGAGWIDIALKLTFRQWHTTKVSSWYVDPVVLPTLSLRLEGRIWKRDSIRTSCAKNWILNRFTDLCIFAQIHGFHWSLKSIIALIGKLWKLKFSCNIFCNINY
jgi:hypothetical protein